MSALLVKICGITRPGDAAAAIAAGADLVGFVFVPGTPRGVDPVRGEWVREVSGAATVGVFRDRPLEEIIEIRKRLALDWVQLHGDEPDEWLHGLGGNVLRRVPVGGRINWERVGRLAGLCLPLIDPGAGDGAVFDWGLLEDRPANLRFGLAGGLTPANVAAAVRAARPALVDVSSGVEKAPGIKDRGKIAEFVGAARAAVESLVTETEER